MKNIKKTIAFIMAVSMVGTFTACGNKTNNSNTSTTEATTFASLKEEDKAAIDEIEVDSDEKLENGVVNWLSFWDINPVEGKAKPVELELFESKYGGTIKLIPTTWETRYDDLANLVIAGNSPDMFPAGDLDTFPGKTVAGMFDPLDDYLDYDSDLWAEGCKKLNDDFMLNGKHYVATVGTDAGILCVYNKKTIEENGLEDPAELLAEGNWNWDTFRQLCLDYCDRSQNKFAYDGWWFEISFLLTTGTPVIGMDNGKVVNNLGTSQISRAEEFLFNLKKDDLPFPHAEYDWQVLPEKVSEGTTLFYPVGTWALYQADLTAYGDSDEIMFVPMPKDPQADEYYLPAGSVTAFALCKDAKNPEGVAKYIECALIAANDETAKEISRNQYIEEYGWTEEMLDMLKTAQDMTNENPVLDFYTAVTNDISNLLNNPIKDTAYNSKEWNQTFNEINDAVQTAVDEFNSKIDAMN